MLTSRKRVTQPWKHLMEITNMKDIVIYGAGGLGREVACLIARINKVSPKWNFVGFFSDSENEWGTENEYGKVLGGADLLNSWPTPVDVAIAIGSSKAIEKIHNKLYNENIDFPNIIDPTFEIIDEHNYEIGKGNIIQRHSSISINVKIGNFNIFNGSDALGHDVIIGDHNVIMPAVRISGMVKIGNNNMLGVGSIVIQQMTIGDHVSLGAGSVLMTKAKKEGVYIGVPAKLFKIN